MLCAPPSSLLAEDDEGALRVTMAAPEDYLFLDPALVDGPAASPVWTILANTNNGLVAFRRKPGRQGTDIEPDLAESVPSPADGRTFTFTIRRGVRFSNDKEREVLPTDVKKSLTRLFYLDSPGAGEFLDIDGAADVLKAGRGEVRGIEADNATRTLTIRLVKPDPAFVKKLALPWAYVLPGETPANDTSVGDPVATGPYMIRRYEPRRFIQLVPNPNWQPLAPRDKDLPARDVRPTRIDVEIGVGVADGLERIRGGDADATLSLIAPDRLKKFEGRREVAIQPKAVVPATYAFFLNTSRPPFDDVRVRKAVDLAVDRRILAGYFAGQAQPTAQVLPPGMPGFNARQVKKPNVPVAKELIKRAKLTAAEKVVTIWAPKDQPVPQAVEYLRRTLRAIDLSPREINYFDRPVYADRIQQQATGAQVGYVSWFAVLPDPADLFTALDGSRIRPRKNPNVAAYRGSDALIRAAEAAPLGARRDLAWSKVDESVADNAPWIPFANLVHSDMVSARVRGYVYSPVYGFVWSLVRLR